MRLLHKIALLLTAAATLPLATVGFALIARHQRALETAVRDTLDQTARHAAAVVAGDVEGRARQLAQTAAMIEWDRLSPDETAGALALLTRQVRATDATVLRAPVPPKEDGSAWAARAPFERARKEGRGAVVYGEPFLLDGRMMLAAATAAGERVLALMIALAPAQRSLDEVRGAGATSLTLVDSAGRLLVGFQPPDATAVTDAVAGKDGHARRFAAGTWLAASAPVGGLGWLVLAWEPADVAFGAAHALRTQTLWATLLAALLALGVAVAFARTLTAALERLSLAARALGAGKLDTRVIAVGDDEVGTLARTFNQMGEELAQGRAEIERWNKELEARVAERTEALKQAQAQLVQAQKLAALGQLGAGVAHEINNPLGGVIGHVQLLLADRTPESADYESLQHIEEGARRASQIVQNLLRFSVQRQSAVRTSVDVNKLVRDTLSLTETLVREQKIDIVYELGDPPPRALADAGQLAQVLLNLVSNARTAMPDGGRLVIRTYKEGNEIALAVEDSGKGIAAELHERIFEPFFTTKDEWSNVGLGLSVSYRLVAEHGGRISVRSEPGHGAAFTVYLPAS